MEDFEYVIERKPPAPVCFGSKLPRNTAPIGKGLSPFQRREAPEQFVNIGPGKYGAERYKTALEKILNKVRSKKGVGPLASDDPRFKEKILLKTPSPAKYNAIKTWGVKQAQNRIAFGSTVGRMKTWSNKLPGPGTYPVTGKKCRRTRFMYNLGYPEMIPAIEICCIANPTDSCVKCEQLCQGDYWQKDYAQFLCLYCWKEEKFSREIFTEETLKSFKKIRNCSFTHRHEGTSAAIRLMPKKTVVKKLRLENYLDLYIKC